MKIKGTELLVKALIEEGVDTLFGYPGGYCIDIFDALYNQDQIEVILPRHEQALIHAADGYARSTGKVGVCLVTSGPGATNLVTGIATANYDSVPLVCFTGQVNTELIGNDAFQEVDIVGITRNICKYAVTVRKREDLGRIIKEAFYIAKTGKPGPVVIDLPKDIMLTLGEDSYPEQVSIRGYKPNINVHMGQLKKAMNLLYKAKHPLFLIGGGVTIAGASEEFTQFIHTIQVPVVTTIMGKGALPTDSPYYFGNVGLHGCYAANMAISECDVLFSIGTRFSDRVTGRISEFAPHATIIHIDIDSAAISRNIKVDIPIVADAKCAIEKMLDYTTPCSCTEWIEKLQTWYKKTPTIMNQTKTLCPQTIIESINELFPESIVVTDVGQHQMWTTQFLQMTGKKKLLTSGGLGTMGYGFPAAIGAKLGNPNTPVICISGDGGMQMNIQELATAVSRELPLILCIFNNNYLGMVRQMQTLFFDRRYSSTCLCYRESCKNNCKDLEKKCPPYTPDFIKLAESYGANGIRVTSTNQIKDALQKASSETKVPTIIEFIIDREELVLPMVNPGKGLNHMILDC